MKSSFLRAISFDLFLVLVSAALIVTPILRRSIRAQRPDLLAAAARYPRLAFAPATVTPGGTPVMTTVTAATAATASLVDPAPRSASGKLPFALAGGLLAWRSCAAGGACDPGW